MNQSSIQTYNLRVETGDNATEIFILNSQFHRVAKALGKVTAFRLPGGLYTIKIRAGANTQEDSIALFEDREIRFDPVRFASPAPLQGTRKTTKEHTSNAVSQSIKIDHSIGEGSQLYLFVRAFDEQERIKPDHKHLFTGLTLRSMHGNVLINLGDPKPGDLITDTACWSACNIELSPDSYILCVETTNGQLLKQTIVTSRNWQTQVFLLQKSSAVNLQHGYNSEFRADLTNSSIFMCRLGEGFSDDHAEQTEGSVSQGFRLTELARQAIVNKRNILSDDLMRTVQDKDFHNPMLGIYCAWLLLQHSKTSDLEKNKSNAENLVASLRRLVGEDHPDVEAIALAFKIPVNHIFHLPPMLRSNWDVVIDATLVQPALVPEGSIASSIAGRIYTSDLWLVWSDMNDANDDGNELELLRDFVDNKTVTQAQNLPPDMLMTLTIKEADKESPPLFTTLATESSKDGSTEPESTNLAGIRWAVESLGIPRARVESMLKELGKNAPKQ